ncbi:hypothetical protein BC936DRAFT_137227, partial [Jimgerdemannia flammicorona]
EIVKLVSQGTYTGSLPYDNAVLTSITSGEAVNFTFAFRNLRIVYFTTVVLNDDKYLVVTEFLGGAGKTAFFFNTEVNPIVPLAELIDALEFGESLRRVKCRETRNVVDRRVSFFQEKYEHYRKQYYTLQDDLEIQSKAMQDRQTELVRMCTAKEDEADRVIERLKAEVEETERRRSEAQKEADTLKSSIRMLETSTKHDMSIHTTQMIDLREQMRQLEVQSSIYGDERDTARELARKSKQELVDMEFDLAAAQQSIESLEKERASSRALEVTLQTELEAARKEALASLRAMEAAVQTGQAKLEAVRKEVEREKAETMRAKEELESLKALTKADKAKYEESASTDLQKRQKAWDNERAKLQAKVEKLEETLATTKTKSTESMVSEKEKWEGKAKKLEELFSSEQKAWDDERKKLEAKVEKLENNLASERAAKAIRAEGSWESEKERLEAKIVKLKDKLKESVEYASKMQLESAEERGRWAAHRDELQRTISLQIRTAAKGPNAEGEESMIVEHLKAEADTEVKVDVKAGMQQAKEAEGGKAPKTRSKKQAPRAVVEDDDENNETETATKARRKKQAPKAAVEGSEDYESETATKAVAKKETKKKPIQKEVLVPVARKGRRAAAVKVVSYNEDDEDDDAPNKITLVEKHKSVKGVTDEKEMLAKKAKVLLTPELSSDDQLRKNSKKRKSDSIEDLSKASVAVSTVPPSSSSSSSSAPATSTDGQPPAKKLEKEKLDAAPPGRVPMVAKDANRAPGPKPAPAKAKKATVVKATVTAVNPPLSPVSPENSAEGSLPGLKKKRKLLGKQRTVYGVENFGVGIEGNFGSVGEFIAVQDTTAHAGASENHDGGDNVGGDRPYGRDQKRIYDPEPETG